ncbi:heavy metal translocating P-type ATPase [Tuanshanicoccus lijuaniae]|uniref:heavy metal translocating P-type ATPase n=1 Tax=Aerococcaceae bacterium zg-1292 TaxID=2774330 RepID=UPI001936041F|nr:heavy metal translocating P-type ATPase [Aerococcaceae bacterium zg-1292]QQA37650.1 heavy metal translocating P-type ATPase [Aerococcaceae bacterium zg-1292]
MKSWIKQNIQLLCTISCAIFIVIGLILQGNNPSLAAICFILGFVIGGWQAAYEGIYELIIERHLSVDILMILAAIGAGIIGYWLEGALLIFIFSLSGTLEYLTMRKSRQTIEALLSLAPQVVRVEQSGHIVEVPIEDVAVGSRIHVRKGDIVPLDGILLSDEAYINEASITGESFPIDKVMHDKLISGTLNSGEPFYMENQATYADSYFNRIVKMVKTAQENQSATDKSVNRIENTYVKTVLVAVPLFIIFSASVLHWGWTHAFYRGMVLLTVASPCALVASASPANLSALSRAAKNGILMKGSDTFDALKRVDAICFDKTGTLTVGQPSVVTSHIAPEVDKQLLSQIVVSAEQHSTHPIALALLNHLDASALSDVTIEDMTGKGIQIIQHSDIWKIGKYDFALEHSAVDNTILQAITDLQSKGHTLIFVSRNQQFAGYFALSDVIKPQAREMIAELKKLGITSIMLTGDQEKTARYVAEQVGIDTIKANCLPADKLDYLQQLQEQGKTVAMVGDGINDAPALALANIGIAMGSGTDVAIETSDIILMKDDLEQLPFLFHLTQRMHGIVNINLIFSLSIIVLLILANVFQYINLPLGVVGHEGSTILVILNGLRLLSFRHNKN